MLVCAVPVKGVEIKKRVSQPKNCNGIIRLRSGGSHSVAIAAGFDLEVLVRTEKDHPCKLRNPFPQP